MRKTGLFLSAAAVLVIALCMAVNGCGKSADGQKDVLARVGNTKITVADLDERIANMPPQYQNVIKKRKKDFLQEVINDNLLYEEALKEGFQKDKEALKVIEEAKKKIIVARFLKSKVEDAIKITDEEIQEFYNANKASFMMPEKMRVSHILVPTKAEADELLKKIQSGTPFEDVARAKSMDPSAQNGGDIGYFPKGQLIPEFESACASLKVGEIGGPVKTKLGYHLIKLTDRKPPQERPLADVREAVKNALYASKRKEKFNELLKDLTEKSNIVVNDKALEGAESAESK